MGKKIYANIKPELLIWAREDAGYSIEEAAEKKKVKLERLKAWESGELSPTISQLRDLGRIYKRPLAVFFLSAPPKKFQAMHDFRRLPGIVAGHESPNLRFEIRNIQRRRQVALELFNSLGIEPVKLKENLSLEDDPEEAASNILQFLSITHTIRNKWTTKYDALNGWRAAFEDHGILVFQFKNVDVKIARGISLSDHPLPVIAVNNKDAVQGRIFTMLHEFVHLLLGKGGLCDLDEFEPRAPEENKIEVYSNYVAGAALLPRQQLLSDDEVKKHGRTPIWSEDDLNNIARRYWVSRETVLRRLLILGKTTHSYYRKMREKFQDEKIAKSEGFTPPSRMVVSTAGPLFVNLVLESFYSDKITSSEVSDFLDVKLKHIPQIEDIVRPVELYRGAAS